MQFRILYFQHISINIINIINYKYYRYIDIIFTLTKMMSQCSVQTLKVVRFIHIADMYTEFFILNLLWISYFINIPLYYIWISLFEQILLTTQRNLPHYHTCARVFPSIWDKSWNWNIFQPYQEVLIILQIPLIFVKE